MKYRFRCFVDVISNTNRKTLYYSFTRDFIPNKDITFIIRKKNFQIDQIVYEVDYQSDVMITFQNIVVRDDQYEDTINELFRDGWVEPSKKSWLFRG